MRVKSFLVTVQVDSKSDLQESVFQKTLSLLCEVFTKGKKNSYAYLYEILPDGDIYKAIHKEHSLFLSKAMDLSGKKPKYDGLKILIDTNKMKAESYF